MKKLSALKLERELRGWSQARVAEELGVTNKTVARWEQKLTTPYPYHRERLCTLFGKNAYELGLLPEKKDDKELASVPSTTNSAVPGSVTNSAVPGSVTNSVVPGSVTNSVVPGSVTNSAVPGSITNSAVPGSITNSAVPGSITNSAAPIFAPGIFDPIIPEAPGNVNSLLGRNALLVQIKQRLMRGKSVALTALVGLPGIGKTALALALANDRQIQAQYNDGILWAGLGPHPNVLSVLTRWGSLLGIRPVDVEDAASQNSWWRALYATIGSKRMLLIIDDAWSAEDALALSVGGRNCAHLMTTRSPQVAAAFAQHETIVIPELEEDDGLALLARFVPQFIEQDEETARELVRMVGGLPLAIKLMGHYLAFQSISGQPRRIRTAIATLQDAQRRLEISIPSKWQEHPPSLSESASLSLHAVIEVSDQHLSAHAHAMLYALAVFPAKPNSFSEEIALAISQEPAEMLDELWDAGLLESSGPGRYMLHQTIADYARKQGQDKQARQRLVQYTLEYLRIHELDYKSIEVEANNLQTGLDVAIELGMYHELAAGIIAFTHYMRVSGRYALAEYYLQEALNAAVQQENQAECAMLLQRLADFSELHGEYDRAESYSQQGLAQARYMEQREIVSALLAIRGNVALHRGNYAQGQAYLEEGLHVAREVGDEKQICILLCNLGRVAYSQTRYRWAKELLLEGLVLARQQGYQELKIPLLNRLGEVVRHQSSYDEAMQYGLEALSLARQLQHRQYLSLTLNTLGITVWSQGKFEDAEAYFLEGLAVAQEIGHREQTCRVLTNLGVLSTYPFQHKYSQAEQYLREGIDLARHIGHNNFLPALLMGLGVTVGVQGDYQQANTYMQESVELARSNHALWQVIASLTYWGVLHLKYNQIDAAAAAFQEVIAIDKTSKQDSQVVAEARYGLATVAALRGDIAEAYRLGQESLAVFEEIKHYMAGEVRRWLRGLAEKEQRFGANHPNARITEE